MKHTSFLKFACLALLIVVTFGPNAIDAATRDWTKHPAVVQMDTTEDIFAVGDPHADYDRLVGVLLAAKIIDGTPLTPQKPVWAAGKSVLVVTGDYIDKWHDSLKVIELLQALQNAAAAQGGRVILTMGNHEAEFLADPHGSKTKEFGDELKAAGLKRNDVADCKGELGKFLCELPIAARVNDWFFCHGGNTANQSIAALSSAIEAGFAKNGFATPVLIGDNSILEARLNKKGPGGLPWFDAGSSRTDPQNLLTEYAAALGVHHIVQGHQPGDVKFPDGQQRKEEDMFQRYGLLFLIDTGMSQGIDGSKSTGGALRITGRKNQQAIVICANGKQQLLWESEKQPAINAQHCGK